MNFDSLCHRPYFFFFLSYFRHRLETRVLLVLEYTLSIITVRLKSLFGPQASFS